MKKTLSILLALVMILGMALPTFAATINITGTENRVYEAYKLMNASVNQDEDNYHYEVNEKYRTIMKDVIVSITSEEVTAAGATATDEEIDAYIIAYLTELRTNQNSAGVRKFADEVYKAILADGTITYDATWNTASYNLDQGYWLIADVTDLSNTIYSNSLALLDTVGDKDVTIAAKPDEITFKKKIDDKNDSNTSEDAISWKDSADYDIGDHVPYQITVTLPSDIENYKTYNFLLGDYASKGLTFDTDSFKIAIGNTSKTIAAAGEKVNGADPDFYYEITTDATTKESTLVIYPSANWYDYDAKAYKAADNENGGDLLAIGAKNNNTIVFDYTCTLNKDAVIGAPGNPNWSDIKFSNNPYGKGYGKTPKDVCIAFTYETIVNKVNNNGEALKGADFDLYKFVADTNGTEVCDGVNGNWVKLDSIKSKDKDGTEATVFTFTGLDDGHYKLKESVVPAGYNGISELHFTVTADHVIEFDAYSEKLLTAINGKAEVTGTINLTADVTKGTLTTDIVNNSGKELPSTGGIGTTLFYLIGAVLVLGAGVVLVSRKRAN